MKSQELLTIPNLITLYRLLAFPFILLFAIAGKESLYAIFLVINLLTDAIDGYIARRFKMETELGAKLDSFADNLTYLLVFIGICVLIMSFLFFGSRLGILLLFKSDMAFIKFKYSSSSLFFFLNGLLNCGDLFILIF